jgi:hypothetical protein
MSIHSKPATRYSTMGGTGLATKISVCNHICPAWVVMDSEVIILYHFVPPSLSQVHTLLCEEVFKTPMISESITRLSVEIMLSNLECKDYNCKL